MTDPSARSTGSEVSRNTFDGPAGVQGGGNNTQFNFYSGQPAEAGGAGRKRKKRKPALFAAAGALLISAAVLAAVNGDDGSGGHPQGEPTFIDSELVLADSNLCVDVDGDKAVDGRKVQLFDCNSPAKGQRWTLNSDGTLQTGEKHCLDVPGALVKEAGVRLGKCGERPERKWKYEWSTRQLKATEKGHEDLCLDDPGGSASNQVALQVYSCLPEIPNSQRWAVRGA